MRTLEREIHTNGTVYTLVKRNSYKAMYRSKEGYYEVFSIRIDPETEIFGNVVPEREHYPSSEEFGKIAWCVKDEERALEIYNKIKKKEK